MGLFSLFTKKKKHATDGLIIAKGTSLSEDQKKLIKAFKSQYSLSKPERPSVSEKSAEPAESAQSARSTQSGHSTRSVPFVPFSRSPKSTHNTDAPISAAIHDTKALIGDEKDTFHLLGVCPELLEILNINSFFTPTEVQKRAIPLALSGKNIFCSSETGSGKTLAFAIPMLQRFIQKSITNALILCPTREIAIQTKKVLDVLTEQFSISSVLVIGGTDMQEQRTLLRTYPEILVATPGRLLDMTSSGLIWLSYTDYVVLDEADRMLDMGFEKDLIQINNELSGTHQTLLFSATLFPEVKNIAHRYAGNYEEIAVGNPRSTANSVEHFLIKCQDHEKIQLLENIVRSTTGKKIVFFNTIKETIQITSLLQRKRIKMIGSLHSEKSQQERERTISELRSGIIKTLLGTDVAARGIDIPNVDMVINFTLPNNPEEYIHRVGRTGRAGKTGMAISMFTPKDSKYLAAIETVLKEKIKIRDKSYVL